MQSLYGSAGHFLECQDLLKNTSINIKYHTLMIHSYIPMPVCSTYPESIQGHHGMTIAKYVCTQPLNLIAK